MSFYETLSLYYDLLFPAAPAQVRFVSGLTPDGGRILDAAAGTGNLALALSGMGFQVTALDIDPGMVERIRLKSGTDHAGLHVLQADMRNVDRLPLPEAFDTVVCVGNSIVHLDSLQEVEETVGRFMALLKPGGALTIQIVNYDRILRERITSLPPLEKSTEGLQVSFDRTYGLEEGSIRFQGTLTVKKDGKAPETFENTVNLLPLKSADFTGILTRQGWEDISFYGSFNGEPFNPDSPAFIFTARKPM